MKILSITLEECTYIGSLRCGPHPYTGSRYDDLIEEATNAMQNSYAPYSRFKVEAALFSKGGKVYAAGYVENVSSGAGICAERVGHRQGHI